MHSARLHGRHRPGILLQIPLRVPNSSHAGTELHISNYYRVLGGKSDRNQWPSMLISRLRPETAMRFNGTCLHEEVHGRGVHSARLGHARVLAVHAGANARNGGSGGGLLLRQTHQHRQSSANARLSQKTMS